MPGVITDGYGCQIFSCSIMHALPLLSSDSQFWWSRPETDGRLSKNAGFATRCHPSSDGMLAIATSPGCTPGVISASTDRELRRCGAVLVVVGVEREPQLPD